MSQKLHALNHIFVAGVKKSHGLLPICASGVTECRFNLNQKCTFNLTKTARALWLCTAQHRQHCGCGAGGTPPWLCQLMQPLAQKIVSHAAHQRAGDSAPCAPGPFLHSVDTTHALTFSIRLWDVCLQLPKPSRLKDEALLPSTKGPGPKFLMGKRDSHRLSLHLSFPLRKKENGPFSAL